MVEKLVIFAHLHGKMVREINQDSKSWVITSQVLLFLTDGRRDTDI